MPETVEHWPKEVLERLSAAVLAITPFTIAEEKFGWLHAGWPPEKVARYEQQLRALLLIPLDLETVDCYAALRAECMSKGLTFGYHDLWIGATAISQEIPLVTCDKSQSTIPGLDAIYLPPTPI
jgi:predicted nucleic acid-binding protein